ncbi:hypothetical protein ACP4OV_017963 [Aristida adscensionis]
MVVLMEELRGLTLKRKGADEPELFHVGGDDRSGFPIASRATKMRRLMPGDDGGPGVAGQQNASSPGAADEEEGEGAVVVYARPTPRLRPWAGPRGGADDWVVRAMLRDADTRTVRELLAGAREQGGGLALVPWVAPPPPPSTAAADGGESEGAEAMDVEEGREQGRQWTEQRTYGGEGYPYRWPQHCMAPPQLAAVAQASPVMMRSW